MVKPSKELILNNICVWCRYKILYKHYPEFCEYIKNIYPNCQFYEGLWLYFHDLDEESRPKCPVCGNPSTFDKFSKGYKIYCCPNCARKGTREQAKQTMLERYGGIGFASKQTMIKTKQTMLERYGVEHSMQCEESKKKAENTNIERYGGKVPTKSNKVQEKIKKTMLERYGVEHALQSSEFLEKSKRTCMEHYGVEHPSQSQEIRIKTRQIMIDRYGGVGSESQEIFDKIKQANLEKYGREYGFDYDKVKQTFIEKYGVDNPSKSIEIQQKLSDIAKQKFLKTHPNIIDIIDNELLIGCCDENCELCKEKCFKLTKSQYSNRIIHNIDLCPIKNPLKVSKDTSIELFIKSILDEYKIEYESNNRSILNPKELDIYIPSKKLAVEINGCYWHSDQEKPNNYHVDKYKECKLLNINLLQFWEDQIINKPEIVKSILLSKLGIYKNRLYARQCIIKEVSHKETVEFLNKNHLQGNANSPISIGLYYDNELVSIMCFGKKRKSLNNTHEDNCYELYRFCNKINTQIIGGASKLLKYFLKIYNPNKIESYSSNDISNGSLYILLGFKQINKSINPSYWYIDKNMKRYHRYNFRKSELIKMGFDPNMSEFEITNSMRLLRIYDSGQNKWEMIL